MAIPLIGALIGPISGLLDTVLSRVLPEDPELKRKAQAEVLRVVHTEGMAELQAAMAIIVAESQGGFLARNWRPAVMLFFTGLVGAYWLGYTAPNLPESTVLELLSIVKFGLSGYVVGRSVEKVAPSIAAALKR